MAQEFAIIKPEPRFDVKVWTTSKGFSWEIEIKDCATEEQVEELYGIALRVVKKDHEALIDQENKAQETEVEGAPEEPTENVAF